MNKTKFKQGDYSVPFLTIDEWEAKLESMGPLAPMSELQSMYKASPKSAPSRGLLGDWILSNGATPGA